MKKKEKDKKITVEDLIATVREINRVAKMLAKAVGGEYDRYDVARVR